MVSSKSGSPLGRYRSATRATGAPVATAPAKTVRSAEGVARLSRSSRFRSFARRHLALLVALVLAAALRVVVAIAYYPALLFHGDSYTYLLNLHQFVPGYGRPFGYPAFLGLLEWTHNLASATIVQHILGLALGVGAYALVFHLGGRRWVALVSALPILFDAYQLDIEQFILAEPLFETLVFGAFLLLLWRSQPTVAHALGAGVLLSLSTLTRLVGVVLVVPALLVLLIERTGWKTIGALVIAFAVPFAAYAGWFDATYGDYAIEGHSGVFLYGRVAQFADCAVMSLPSYDDVLCQKLPAGRRPGPNFYDWERGSPRFRLRPPEGVSKQQALSTFAHQAILHQPLDYASVIAGDVAHYFAPGRFVGPRDWYLLTWVFPANDAAYGARWHSNPADRTFTLTHYRANPDWALAPFLRSYQHVAYTEGPALLVALILACAGTFAWRRREEGDRQRRAAAGALALAGVALLVVPAATADFDYRYLLPTLVLVPPAGAIGLTVCLPGMFAREGRPRANRRRRFSGLSHRPTAARGAAPGGPPD